MNKRTSCVVLLVTASVALCVFMFANFKRTPTFTQPVWIAHYGELYEVREGVIKLSYTLSTSKGPIQFPLMFVVQGKVWIVDKESGRCWLFDQGKIQKQVAARAFENIIGEVVYSNAHVLVSLSDGKIVFNEFSDDGYNVLSLDSPRVKSTLASKFMTISTDELSLTIGSKYSVLLADVYGFVIDVSGSAAVYMKDRLFVADHSGVIARSINVSRLTWHRGSLLVTVDQFFSKGAKLYEYDYWRDNLKFLGHLPTGMNGSILVESPIHALPLSGSDILIGVAEQEFLDR